MPTFVGANDQLDISADPTSGDPLAVLASGEVTASSPAGPPIATANPSGDGGNVTLIAGASVAPPAAPGPGIDASGGSGSGGETPLLAGTAAPPDDQRDPAAGSCGYDDTGRRTPVTDATGSTTTAPYDAPPPPPPKPPAPAPPPRRGTDFPLRPPAGGAGAAVMATVAVEEAALGRAGLEPDRTPLEDTIDETCGPLPLDPGPTPPPSLIRDPSDPNAPFPFLGPLDESYEAPPPPSRPIAPADASGHAALMPDGSVVAIGGDDTPPGGVLIPPPKPPAPAPPPPRRGTDFPLRPPAGGAGAAVRATVASHPIGSRRGPTRIGVLCTPGAGGSGSSEPRSIPRGSDGAPMPPPVLPPPPVGELFPLRSLGLFRIPPAPTPPPPPPPGHAFCTPAPLAPPGGTASDDAGPPGAPGDDAKPPAGADAPLPGGDSVAPPPPIPIGPDNGDVDTIVHRQTPVPPPAPPPAVDLVSLYLRPPSTAAPPPGGAGGPPKPPVPPEPGTPRLFSPARPGGMESGAATAAPPRELGTEMLLTAPTAKPPAAPGDDAKPPAGGGAPPPAPPKKPPTIATLDPHPEIPPFGGISAGTAPGPRICGATDPNGTVTGLVYGPWVREQSVATFGADAGTSVTVVWRRTYQRKMMANVCRLPFRHAGPHQYTPPPQEVLVAGGTEEAEGATKPPD